MKFCLKNYILVSMFFANLLFAQQTSYPDLEITRLLFVSEVQGLNASMVNPAGLSVKPDDDGVMLSYDFFDINDGGNSYAGITMGNLGFSYQSIMENNVKTFHNYALSLSIGGKFLSIGTTNRLVQIDTTDTPKYVFAMDGGFVLQPATWLILGAVARNVNEPDSPLYQLNLGYQTGVQIKALGDQVRLFIDTAWDRQTSSFDNARHQAALAIAPTENLEVRVGGIRDEGKIEYYFGQVSLPGPGGMRVSGTLRMSESDRKVQRYALSVLLPLQTVRF